MAEYSPSERYARSLAVLHWLMAALVIGLIVLIEVREFIPKENPLRAEFKTLHFSLGLTVLAFLLVRLGVRVTTTAPPIVPKPAAWQTGLSHLMHLALYAMMLGLPILGWVALSALGKDISLFGLPLPALVTENREFGHDLEELHKELGEVMMYLIGLHAAAALFHHAVVKDNTLVRMLPGR